MLNLALALASAILLILAFPRFNFAFLAAVAIAPLLVALAREPQPWRRLLLGWLAGTAYWAGACYWIQFVLEVHGGLGVFGKLGRVPPVLPVEGVATGRLWRWRRASVIRRVYAVPVVAAIWVALERTNAPLGFAWQALGNAGINMSVPLRLAPYTGVYGLSFVFAMMGTAVAVALLRQRRREMAWLGALLLLYLLPGLPDAGPAPSAPSWCSPTSRRRRTGPGALSRKPVSRSPASVPPGRPAGDGTRRASWSGRRFRRRSSMTATRSSASR